MGIINFLSPHRAADSPQTYDEFRNDNPAEAATEDALQAESNAKSDELAAINNGLIPIQARIAEGERAMAADNVAYGGKPPADIVAAKQRRVDSDRASLAQQQELASKVNAQSGSVRSLHKGWTRYLRDQVLPTGVTLKRVSVKLPTGEKLEDIVAAERRKQKALRSELEVKLSYVQPEDAFLAQAIAQVPVVRAPFNVHIDHKFNASLRWQEEVVDAEPRFVNGGAPSVADARAIAAWLAYEDIVDEIKRQVAELYSGNPPTASRAEKKKWAAEIDAKILASERIEAAACWASRQKGNPIPWRGDISILAVFGVDGPVPHRRD